MKVGEQGSTAIRTMWAAEWMSTTGEMGRQEAVEGGFHSLFRKIK